MRILKETSAALLVWLKGTPKVSDLLMICPLIVSSRVNAVWLTTGVKTNEPLPLATDETVVTTEVTVPVAVAFTLTDCLKTALLKSRVSYL